MKNIDSNLLIVIPCFNEYKRLDIPQYVESLNNNKNISLLFVDDGSEDLTIERIEKLQKEFPHRIIFLRKEKNEGKAAAIYDGFSYAINHLEYDYIGYIDADLAVDIEEIHHLQNILLQENKQFIFGARWKRIGSKIKRKLVRHYIGRIFATIASLLLNLGIYDTQCGAKIFTNDLAKKVFTDKFNVNWCFDIEIFFRLLKIFPRENFDKYCLEFPLKSWKDVDGSKIKVTHTINVLKDFWILHKKYR